jgi:hypothetical protein
MVIAGHVCIMCSVWTPTVDAHVVSETHFPACTLSHTSMGRSGWLSVIHHCGSLY